MLLAIAAVCRNTEVAYKSEHSPSVYTPLAHGPLNSYHVRVVTSRNCICHMWLRIVLQLLLQEAEPAARTGALANPRKCA